MVLPPFFKASFYGNFKCVSIDQKKEKRNTWIEKCITTSSSSVWSSASDIIRRKPHRPVSAASPRLYSGVAGPLILGGVIVCADAGCLTRSHSSQIISFLFSQIHRKAFSTVCWRAHFNLLTSDAEKLNWYLKMLVQTSSYPPRTLSLPTSPVSALCFPCNGIWSWKLQCRTAYNLPCHLPLATWPWVSVLHSMSLTVQAWLWIGSPCGGLPGDPGNTLEILDYFSFVLPPAEHIFVAYFSPLDLVKFEIIPLHMHFWFHCFNSCYLRII